MPAHPGSLATAQEKVTSPWPLARVTAVALSVPASVVSFTVPVPGSPFSSVVSIAMVLVCPMSSMAIGVAVTVRLGISLPARGQPIKANASASAASAASFNVGRVMSSPFGCAAWQAVSRATPLPSNREPQQFDIDVGLSSNAEVGRTVMPSRGPGGLGAKATVSQRPT